MSTKLENYKTIDQVSEEEIVINKSRFIARCYPISSEEEANKIINKVKKEHYKANHVCSAWVLAEEPAREKSSDDGEPSGTAGKPILEVLKHKELKNILVLVIRYFGGIKLGAGGLIRAYSSSAANVLKPDNIVIKRRENIIEIQTEYSHYQNLKLHLEKLNIKPVDETFSEVVTLLFYMPEDKTESFIKDIEDFTNDNYLADIKGKELVSHYLDEKEILL